ncbi:hypothetical protein D3C81_284130 [compost metagenome]
MSIPVRVLRERTVIVQRPDVQLSIGHEYVLRAVRVMLQLRIAPAPGVGIFTEVITRFIIPFACIERGAAEFILPDEIHAGDGRIGWRSDGDVVLIGFIGTRCIGVADEVVVYIVAADISAGLPV